MKENHWNFTFPESFSKTMEEWNKVQLSASALAISQAWRASMPKYELSGAFTALNEIVASHKAWSEMVLPTQSFSEMVASAYPTLKMDVSTIAQSVLAQVDTSALAALRDSASMATALAKADWSWLSEVYSEKDDPATLEEKEVAPEIRAEMAADITEVIAEPETMHLTSQNKYLEWVKKHPELAVQFLTLLLMFIQTICMMVSTWQARPVKDSQVYQEPASTSNVVYNLTVENNVTVIGDVPYYYEVEFVHPETGELVTGYIYKGNVVAEESAETEALMEETIAVEVSEPIPDATEVQTEPTE